MKQEEYDIIKILQDNLTDIHIFNYQEKLEKIIQEYLQYTTKNNIDEKLYINTIQRITHQKMWDAFDACTSMRDETIWNRNFQKTLQKIQPKIIKIDKKTTTPTTNTPTNTPTNTKT